MRTSKVFSPNSLDAFDVVAEGDLGNGLNGHRRNKNVSRANICAVVFAKLEEELEARFRDDSQFRRFPASLFRLPPAEAAKIHFGFVFFAFKDGLTKEGSVLIATVVKIVAERR